jgi:hypothetical protein
MLYDRTSEVDRPTLVPGTRRLCGNRDMKCLNNGLTSAPNGIGSNALFGLQADER